MLPNASPLPALTPEAPPVYVYGELTLEQYEHELDSRAYEPQFALKGIPKYFNTFIVDSLDQINDLDRDEDTRKEFLQKSACEKSYLH